MSKEILCIVWKKIKPICVLPIIYQKHTQVSFKLLLCPMVTLQTYNSMFQFFFERQSVQCISHENSSKTHHKLRVTAEPHTLQQSTCFLPNFQLWILHQLLCFYLPQVLSINRIVLQTVLYCWSVAGTRKYT